MNNKLFLTAYTILADTPEKNIHLGLWVSQLPKFYGPDHMTFDCNTLACGAGILCLSPIMQAEGLFYAEHPTKNYMGLAPRIIREGECLASNFMALVLLFEIETEQAEHLFSARDTHRENVYEPKWAARLTDKQLLLRRFRAFWRSQGHKVVNGKLINGKLMEAK